MIASIRRALAGALTFLALASLATAATVYSTNGGSSLMKFDTGTRAATVIGNFGFSNVWAVEFNRSGTLYATVNWGVQLATVNRQTGAATVVANLPQTIISIAIDANGTMYGVGYNNGTLYTINTTTGALTTLGQTGVNSSMDASFDANGNLWILDGGSRLYRVNKTNGAIIENLALPVGGVMTLAIDGTNKAYFMPHNFNAPLWVLDLNSRQFTNLGIVANVHPHGGAIEFDECDALRAELDALETSYLALQTQYTALQTTQSNTSASLAAANTQVSQLQAQVSQLQAQSSQLQAQNATLTSANQKLSSDLAASQASISTLQTQLATANDRVASLTTELNAANDALAAVTTERDELAAQLDAAAARIAQLTAQNGNLTQALVAANAQVAALTIRVATLDSQVAALTGANQALTADLASANARIAALVGDVATLNSANAALRSQLAAAQAANTALQGEKAALTSSLNAALSSNASLQTQLAAAQAEIARLTASSTSVQGSLLSIGGDLGRSNGDANFKIAGATIEQQTLNLTAAISQLNPGQKLALFKNLGGTKK